MLLNKALILMQIVLTLSNISLLIQMQKKPRNVYCEVFCINIAITVSGLHPLYKFRPSRLHSPGG